MSQKLIIYFSRFNSEIYHKLIARIPSGQRSKFIIEAIEVALNGGPDIQALVKQAVNEALAGRAISTDAPANAENSGNIEDLALFDADVHLE